jgi:hypothetical protein
MPRRHFCRMSMKTLSLWRWMVVRLTWTKSAADHADEQKAHFSESCHEPWLLEQVKTVSALLFDSCLPHL